MTRCHTQRPPAVEGLTALHHYQVNQVSWRRLVVRRQQKTVQGEEDFLLHHSTVSIHTGHTCLKTEEERAERTERHAVNIYGRLSGHDWTIRAPQHISQCTWSSLILPDQDGHNVKGPQTEPERSTEEDQLDIWLGPSHLSLAHNLKKNPKRHTYVIRQVRGLEVCLHGEHQYHPKDCGTGSTCSGLCSRHLCQTTWRCRWEAAGTCSHYRERFVHHPPTPLHISPPGL